MFVLVKSYVRIYYMEIAKRDLKIILLKEAINANREFVIQKIKTLNEAQKENQFLKTVYNDYRKYYSHIVEQKIKQEAQMSFLVDYLEKSIVAAGLSKSQVCQAKSEQNRILEELDSIRNDLEYLIDNK